jgi:hypothetical protein
MMMGFAGRGHGFFRLCIIGDIVCICSNYINYFGADTASMSSVELDVLPLISINLRILIFIVQIVEYFECPSQFRYYI